MALILDVENLTLVTNEDRLGKLILSMTNALVARGWTMQDSGDGIATYQNAGQTAGPYNVFTSGTGYVTTGGVWTTALGGANKITNTRAWIRLREPSPSVREIIIQRSSGNTTGFDMYMVAGMAYAGYLANNATATTPPTSAGTSQILFGNAFNGTGAVFLDATTTIASTHTLVFNLLVSDVVKAANSWPFYFVVYNSTTASRTAGWIYESLLDYVSGDPDPVVSGVGVYTNVFGNPNAIPGMNFIGRRDDGTVLTSLQVLYYVNAFGSIPTLSPATNPLDNKSRSLPCFLASSVVSDGRYKGRMEHFTLNVQARNYPSTLDVATASAKLYLGALVGPWKQSTTPGT